jgi:uncharacterized protein
MDKTKVLVTGAGSGIGREFTKLFIADGSEVLAVSLLDEELTTLAADLDTPEHSLKTLQMDLATPDAGDKLFEWCTKNNWMPDTLVNNAGFACFGDSVDLPPDRITEMLTLNVITLTTLSMLFGKVMKDRRRGAILNVGSIAGMIPSSRVASYGGSKSYVNTFSYALAAELKPYGVTVTCLTPGATRTNFSRTGGFDQFTGKSLIVNWYRQGKAGSPEDVAKAGYQALKRGQRQALVGKGATLAVVASRIVSQKHLPHLMKNP